MTIRVYEGHGIRFEYPFDWELEETEDDDATIVEVQAPGGLAFALVRTDDGCPNPEQVAEEVFEAMRAEYPEVDAFPAVDTLDGHHATGYDVEFFSLDVTNAATIRSFRTSGRTVLVFGQWSDIAGEDYAEMIRGVVKSIAEVEN